MSDITINPANGPLTIKTVVTTPQVVGYEVTIYDKDGNTVLATYLSDSGANNPYTIQLPQSAKFYQGRYATVTLSVIDPVGAGNNFDIDYSIQQLGQDLAPVQHITGVTTATKIIRIAIYHIN